MMGSLITSTSSLRHVLWIIDIEVSLRKHEQRSTVIDLGDLSFPHDHVGLISSTFAHEKILEKYTDIMIAGVQRKETRVPAHLVSAAVDNHGRLTEEEQELEAA